eukprot:g35923.t1
MHHLFVTGPTLSVPGPVLNPHSACSQDAPSSTATAAMPITRRPRLRAYHIQEPRALLPGQARLLPREKSCSSRPPLPCHLQRHCQQEEDEEKEKEKERRQK